MKIVAEMSLYPLKDGPIPDIIAFIDQLRTQPGLEVVSNQLSTQLRGEFDVVMDALKTEIGTTFEAVPKAVFAIRILNNPL